MGRRAPHHRRRSRRANLRNGRLSVESYHARREAAWKAQGIFYHGVPLTWAVFERCLAAQGGWCAVCDAKQEHSIKAFAADHGHETNEFRGVLCYTCNRKVVSITEQGKTIHLKPWMSPDFNDVVRAYLSHPPVLDMPPMTVDR